MEEGYDFSEILGYYLKATVILNIILIIAVLIINKFWIWNEELSNDFIIRYVIVGSILGLFLPKLYYDVRKMRKKEK